jgi:hypothetical protein
MMKHFAALVLCVWALLEPPYTKDGMTPLLKTPYKDWTVAHFNRGDMTIPYYFDTRAECEKRRSELAYGDEKVCLPVNTPLNNAPWTHTRKK